MAFRFSLEALLRFRQTMEENQRLQLQALLARRAALNSELQQCREDGLRLRERVNQSLLDGPTVAAEIHFAIAQGHAIEHQQQRLEKELSELQTAVVEQMSRYREERRKREVLEALRESQFSNYRLLLQRREHAQQDELHLLRRARVQR